MAGEEPIEPSAALRQAAYEFRQMYIALLDQGFTKDEALNIIGSVIARGTGK